MASQVDRTQPGSKNDWRITYDTGSQKWTDDRPGDGIGDSSGDMLKETLDEPAVQRGLNTIQKAIEADKDLKPAVDAMIRDTGTEKGKTVLNAVYKAAKGSKQEEGWDKARKMVAKGMQFSPCPRYICPECGGVQNVRCPGPRYDVERVCYLCKEGIPKNHPDRLGESIRLSMGKQANIKDVVNKIFDTFRIDQAKEIAQRVVDFWKTKNKKYDLEPREQSQIYRREDYGDVLPLTKKRKLDIEWSDHAEYRSDLRDVDPDAVNEAIRDRLKEKLNPPQKKKQNFKEPGVGTMVVDYNTKNKPAEAEIVTVWAKESRAAVAAVMDRVNPDDLPLVWYENEAGDKFIPDMYSGEPGRVPEGYDYQHSQFSDLKHSILKIVTQEEVDACDHPDDYIRKDHGYDPSYGGQIICDKCGGRREKPKGQDWNDWRGEGSRDLMTMNSGWSDDLVLEMGKSGIPLHKAIMIAANACERCMNSLAYEFGLDWGYEEGSKEWRECGTSCDFCEGMGYEGLEREGLNQFPNLASNDFSILGPGGKRRDTMSKKISKEFVSADEMEQYCPECARQIRSGELQVTREELEGAVVDKESIAERVASNFTKTAKTAVKSRRAGSWINELEEYYGRKADFTRKDTKRIMDMGEKAWAKYPGDHRSIRSYTLNLAKRMAQSIKHADKAYRRARAAENENYHSEADIFFKRAEELWRAMSKTAASRVADRWINMPKGWTDKSRKKFWDTLTGDVKHKVTKCIKEMEGKIDNPGAFCASLADRVDPGWRSRKK